MNFLVFAEHRNGAFKKSTYEAVRTASRLAQEKGGIVTAITIGKSIESSAPILGEYGASKVYIADDPRLETYSTSGYVKVISDFISHQNIDIVFLSATSMGKDLAPRLAVRIDSVIAPDCIELHWSDNNLIARRPVYAGKALIDVSLNTAKKIFTLRPNVFSSGNPNGSPCSVELFTPSISDTDIATHVTDTKTASGKLDVTEASVIVSGGRGMQGAENFHLIESLANVMHAATGASRAVVDAGWRPHAEQVGQTGKTVSPTLYVACGISGAIQHLAGMSTSKVIVAINKDKDAPIFQIADYGIVGDVFEVLPVLISELQKYFGY